MYRTPVEILTIGDELLLGQTVNTNASWLASHLTELGYAVRWMTTCSDEVTDLGSALALAVARAQLVVATGGLGPTEDDRTVELVARLAGVGVSRDAAAWARIQERYAAAGVTPTPTAAKQAEVPTGALVLANSAGLAPGFCVTLPAGGAAAAGAVPGAPTAATDAAVEAGVGGAGTAGAAAATERVTGIFLPGVPREMKAIFREQVVPLLEGRTTTARAVCTYRTIGLREAVLDGRLVGLLEGTTGATLHLRTAFPENHATLVVEGATPTEVAATRARLDGEIRQRLGRYLYGTGDETFPQALGRVLREHDATLALAESCTGGLAGHLVTDAPGSSDYFLLGCVTYSNAAKEAVLGVPPATLATHGAVSDATVREMAEGVRRVAGATLGVAVSGIAGPGGGSPEKPVGTVFLAVAGPAGTRSRHFQFRFGREMVKRAAAFAALELAFRYWDPAGAERQ